jgi:hypothetical protein
MKILAALGAALFLIGCGGEDTPPAPEKPSPAAVRATYGLSPGSCWKYRYSQGGVDLFATVDVEGPNMNAIAGRTVYIRRLRLESGGLPVEDYFDTESNAEIVLLRHVEGRDAASRVTKRYDEDATPPIFARFRNDAMKNAVMRAGDKFETMSTPKDMPAERHVWSVLAVDEPAMTPMGEMPSYKLQYTRGTSETALYNIVPNFGAASFVDFAGVTHQVCAARVCDAAGACTGADSCSNLTCM